MDKLKYYNNAQLSLLFYVSINTRSPFVVSLAYAYEDKSDLNLVMTLMGSGDLKFHIHEIKDKKKGLSPERTKFYSAQITVGMDHLHRENILYRDLKPENVLLDDHGNVRIADLGLVCVLEDGQTTTGRAGTIGFMAPEMLKNENYAYGVDWFALGCTIYEMIEGRGPFVVKLKVKTKIAKLKKPVPRKSQIYLTVFPKRKMKSKRKVCIDSTVKKTIEEPHTYKRSHDKSIINLIDQLLEKDVANRLAGNERPADQIKRHPYFSDINWERLEAGLVSVPFVPDQKQVYAKNVSDIRLGSEVKGVTLDDNDKSFHKKFASGRVAIPWQQEMIETGLFEEVMDRPDPSMKGGKEKAKSKSKFCVVL